MKQTVLSFVLTAVAVAIAHGETCPNWDAITVTTSVSGQIIAIHAARGAGRLTNLVVNVGTNAICVPSSVLEKSSDPQLDSLRLGYWNKELKQYYVALICGRLSSFPRAQQPNEFRFYFTDGAFSRTEVSPTTRKKEDPTEQRHAVSVGGGQ